MRTKAGTVEESPTRPPRLTDRQALAVIGGWLGARAVTVRLGLVLLPWLLTHAPWAIPLLRNALLAVVAAGAAARRSPPVLVAIGAASLAVSTVGGLVLWWAGSRFGPQLAQRAARRGSVWSGVWNPKQVERAARWVDRWGFAAVAASRAVGWLVTPVALVAGSSGMGLRRYLPAYLLGTVLWASGALWLGVRAGSTWPWLPDRIKAVSELSLKAGLGALALAAVLAAAAAALRAKGEEPAAGPPAPPPGALPADPPA